jgi:thioredoxin-dependent peroxiredoxin
MIAAGDTLPNADVMTAGGTATNLSAYRGRPLVLYFYPKASTPGCTTEAIEFSAAMDDFTHLGIAVAGMSADSPKKQSSFIAKNDLTTDILSDESTDFLSAIGVWAEKSMYGKAYMGIIRTTLLINADGVVEHVWSPVKVKGHVADVLESARAKFG